MKKALIITGIVMGSLIVGAIGFMLVLYAIGNSIAEEASNEPETEAAATTEEVKEAYVFDKSVYENIKKGDSLTGVGGDTYEEVVKQLGEPSDKMHSESDGSNSKDKVLDCTWYDDNYSSISVTFTNGRVSYKLYIE